MTVNLRAPIVINAVNNRAVQVCWRTRYSLEASGGKHRAGCRLGVTMLILTRKKDESIVIGNDIVIKIVDVEGGQR